MSDEEEFLSATDFANIKDLRTKSAFVASRAEKAILESKVSELEYRTAVLNVYVKYGLKLSDSIDENTGKILRAALEAVATEEVKTEEITKE